MVTVARLQSKVGTKDLYELHTKYAPKRSPKCLDLFLVGLNNPAQSPLKFPQDPLQSMKRDSPTSFCSKWCILLNEFLGSSSRQSLGHLRSLKADEIQDIHCQLSICEVCDGAHSVIVRGFRFPGRSAADMRPFPGATGEMTISLGQPSCRVANVHCFFSILSLLWFDLVWMTA